MGAAVSNEEFRDVLLNARDDFRNHVLWQIERTLDKRDSTEFDQWIARAQELFGHVWPRQRSVKSPTMSVALVRLLVSSVESFSKMVDVVIPHLTKIDNGDHLHFGPQIGAIVDSHSEAFLGMMHTILPDDPSRWPYGSAEVLEKIGQSNKHLLSDPRLQELNRRWNAR